MQTNSNNADIEYLISMFQEDLDLLRDYGQKPEIDPQSRAYLQSFISHVDQNKHTHNSYATDFIDYGTKMMAYLSKNGVKSIDISDQSADAIFKDMVNSPVLREALVQQIEKKKKNNGSQQDIIAMNEALTELNKKPIDYEKFKQKLARVNDL